MPSTRPHSQRRHTSDEDHTAVPSNQFESYVHISAQNKDDIVSLNHTLTGHSARHAQQYPEAHEVLNGFLLGENQKLSDAGLSPPRLGVCFKNITTWGSDQGSSGVKTLATAIWRTLTFQDVYEMTLKRWASPPAEKEGRALIRNFSGVVGAGEMMLVLGRPGSGCSTFLRTVANNHTHFLKVTGSLDYSGLSPADISKSYRSQVSYVPEDDIHYPTLSTRQTLEFAFESKTPKRHQQSIPEFMETYSRVFGISHILDTLVGDEYIRGVSGGERKRISIVESLAAGSSVVAWDNTTRGLDAASAIDYARSLRIMTDTCGKATIVSLYQASDAVFELMDTLLLIDAGRMIFQGPANVAKSYFESLGYACRERQTIADFLASVTSIEERRFKEGWEAKAPKGPIELENAFRASRFFQDIQYKIHKYEEGLNCPRNSDQLSMNKEDIHSALKSTTQAQKSRFVRDESSYKISFARQVFICAKRQWWQLKGDPAPFYAKTLSTIINAFLVGSLFYSQPTTSDGAFSRGGFLFYSAVLLGWIQLAELEEVFRGREIISRQKKFAFVRPAAVNLALVLMDLVVVLVQVILYTAIAYFLSGMQRNGGPFFIFFIFVYFITVCMTTQFRIFGIVSPTYEVALRYSGVLLLLYIVFGGYLLSIELLWSQVPWFGWITYLLPLRYTYEAMIAAEFHGLQFACSLSSIIPNGPSYINAVFQSCAIPGSTPGSLNVDGDAYIAQKFGFYYSNVWRDFGILILFAVAFAIIACVLSEIFDWSNGGSGAIEYRKAPRNLSRKGRDEEEHGVECDSGSLPSLSSKEKMRKGVPSSKEVFTWRNLEYSIEYEGGRKVLLNKVSGYCRPGEMTALVGVSGAGKTTLLNALAQRHRGGHLTGDMLVNGRPNGPQFKKATGFCEQMDIHDDSSTIREAFEFSALLRQSPDVSQHEKFSYVDQILELLELTDMQDAIIWSLPLEQKRRTTIGVELCAKPSLLLFLDEPTSGLDSQGAYSILLLLRRLADAGQSILCTIHQANHQQFTLFNNVLALNPGGNTFYFGDIGPSGKTIFDYFSKHGIPIEDGKNVADFLIEVGAGVAMSTDQNLNWNDVWATSREAQDVQKEIQKSCARSKALAPKTEEFVSPPFDEFSASTWLQLCLLTKRISRQYWRTAEYPYSRLYASFLHALLNGFTFFQLGNSITDMQSRMFACFLILMLVPEFMNATSMRFITNRAIWESREYPSRTYGRTAFAVAQIVSELPYAVIGSVLFFTLVYFPVGLPLGVPALYTYLMVLLFFLFITSWGQWIGALSKNATIAANLMPFFVIMCELSNGVLRTPSQMPTFWRYTMYYITPFTYWIGGILSSTLHNQPVVCNAKDLSFFNPPPGIMCGVYAESWLQTVAGYIVNPDAPDLCGYCQYDVADDYLVSINLDASKAWPYLGIFTGYVISNVLLVFIFVWLYWWRYMNRKEGPH